MTRSDRIAPGARATGSGGAPGTRRWWGLVVVSVAALMSALDSTVLNVALPSAQADLGFDSADRQWVVTIYALVFAGLLVLGGRVSDAVGPRRAFLTGLAGFAAASALAGLAGAFWVLLLGRALQGVFAALLAPTTVSLIGLTFTDPRERGRAFAVYGAIASAGGVVGLVLGGLLTSGASWRWCLFVNVLIAVGAAAGALLALEKGRASGGGSFDVLGTVLVVGGLMLVMWGVGRASKADWLSSDVLVPLVAGLALVGLFLLWESRVREPLMPLSLLFERNRAGAALATAAAAVGSFGVLLLLSYYFQAIRGYSPLHTGLSFLPMTAAAALSAFFVATPLLPRVPPRVIMVPGLLAIAGGLATLAGLGAGSGYGRILVAIVLMGAGLGATMTPAFSLATLGVERARAGVASAIVSAALQMGGSVGLAVLNTVAISTVALGALGAAPDLIVGYARAMGWGAGIVAVAAVVVLFAIRVGRPRPRAG